MPLSASFSTTSRNTFKLAYTAISAMNRDKVGCEASPSPSSGVSLAEELDANRKC